MIGIEKVVRGGYCVGCGSCAVASRGHIGMVRDQFGVPTPKIGSVDHEALARISKVCPFSDDAPNEEVIALERYPTSRRLDAEIGRYEGVFAGRIVDDKEVLRSSSGGLTTWLLTELLERRLIDGVVHLGRSDSPELGIFDFVVSHSIEEVRRHRKSQYFSADFSRAIDSIKGNGKRYAFVGVPCYAKAVRQLALDDAEFNEQLAYVIALVCGHMKAPAFAELLAWQLGVEPKDIATVDFRVKEGSTRADDYNFSVTSTSGEVKIGKTRDLYGTNWGHAMFQLRACDFCDDVFGETADVCFGDAWLDRFAVDPRGTNLVVVRSVEISKILEQGKTSGAVSLEAVSRSDALRSQAGNFRHRREGLAVRIRDTSADGEWHPQKRGFVSYRDVSIYRRVIVRLRRTLGVRTHSAFLAAKQSGSLSVFLEETSGLVRRMELVYKLPLLASPKQIVTRVLAKIAKKLGYAG